MGIHLGGGAGVNIRVYPRGRGWILKIFPLRVAGTKFLGGYECGGGGTCTRPAQLSSLPQSPRAALTNWGKKSNHNQTYAATLMKEKNRAGEGDEGGRLQNREITGVYPRRDFLIRRNFVGWPGFWEGMSRGGEGFGG